VGSLNIKDSTISHMAAVHPGALATRSPQKEGRRRTISILPNIGKIYIKL
jgi:hypothetical protein